MFEPGTSSATISGKLAAGAPNSYLLQIADGQIMTINLTGPDSAGIGLSDSQGLLLESESPVTSWVTTPLTAGDVTLTVAGPTAGSYELVVSIEDNFQADNGRIEFEPGASSATISGELEADIADTYLLQVADGQIMTISLTGPESAGIGLSDSEGLLLESESPVTSWVTGPLTAGDVTLSVAGPTAGSYEMTVTIENAGENTGPSSEGMPDGIFVSLNPLGEVRLAFPGTTGADLQGSLIQIDGVEIYKVGEASPYQTLPYQSLDPVSVGLDTIVVEDVNFDGYTDLGIPSFTPAGSNVPLGYQLWDSTIDQFIRSEPFDVLWHPTILDGKRILTRSTFGAANVDFVLYKIDKGGPVAVGRQSCEFMAGDDGSTVTKNIGYAIDLQGVETQTFEEISAEDCLDYKATP